jgi:hypothetical protein
VNCPIFVAANICVCFSIYAFKYAAIFLAQLFNLRFKIDIVVMII